MTLTVLWLPPPLELFSVVFSGGGGFLEESVCLDSVSFLHLAAGVNAPAIQITTQSHPFTS